MMCTQCQAMAATTAAQLAVRLRNIRNHPEISVYQCPNCKNTDWATTDEFIVPDQATEHWLDRLDKLLRRLFK